MTDTAAPLRVARLRTQATADDALRVRLAAEALVGRIDPTLPGLAPQAVLLLRRLALPWPADSQRLGTDPRSALAFAARAEAALADAARRARRPLLDAVPEDADAVLFGDEAELLACLARDAAAGRLQRWWWRRWLGAAHPRWPQAFAERPQAALAARRWLVRWGLDDWVRRVCSAAGLDPASMAARIATGVPPADLATPAGTPVLPDDAAAPAAVARAPALASRRWRPAPVGADRPPATPASRQSAAAAAAAEFSAIARAMPHPAADGQTRAAATPAAGGAPPAATMPFTADAIDRVSRPPARPGDPGPEPHPAMPTAVDGTVAAASAAPPRGSDTVPGTGAERRRRKAAPSAVRWQAALRRARAEVAPVAHTTVPGWRSRRATSAVSAEFRPDSAGVHSAPNARPAPDDDSVDAARPVATAWGGAFFLVNAFIARGWVADFTQPAGGGLALSPWALLAAVARTLVGPALRRDPLWPLLWTLAERPPAPAPRRRPWRGVLAGSAAPATARLARRATPATRWPVRATPAGRVARHAVPAAGRRTDRRAVAAAGRRTAALRPPSPTAAAPDPGHAIARLARSLREPLALALGVGPAELATTLLRQPAQVWASAGEVVVVFERARHPVAVRRAGLDRAPGWLPGAERRLRFVFR